VRDAAKGIEPGIAFSSRAWIATASTGAYF
jgi:hypothetical protein